MSADLKDLRIDRTRKRSPEPSRWATRWIVGGVLLFAALGAGRFVYGKLNAPIEVEVMRVQAASAGGSGTEPGVILNATGYIVAHHKIQVASKVLGKVAWIGVDKADKVKEGQIIVRLEDDEYRAQLQQATGQLANLEARLKELLSGSRPEEIAVAEANLNQAKADLENSRIGLARTEKLVAATVSPQQQLDDAKARHDSAVARVRSLERTHELARIGPRAEQIEAVRGQIEQARGSVAFYQTQLNNTVIRAPSAGTILERAVEKGEFVTTSFVGERGAKGYVVSLADLNDLQVELDISQNDFARLKSNQRGIITTDAFPDRKYQGVINEISPEANRQKATVQVKVKVENPDSYLRPEMNASVAFLSDEKPAAGGTPLKAVLTIPASAVRGDAVFVLLGGKAVRRVIKAGSTTSQGVRVEEGLIGGEDLIVAPPANLKEGDAVQRRKS